jgi:hypothetical protein
MAGGIERDSIAFWFGKSSLAFAIGFLLFSESVAAIPARFSPLVKAGLFHSPPNRQGLKPMANSPSRLKTTQLPIVSPLERT